MKKPQHEICVGLEAIAEHLGKQLGSVTVRTVSRWIRERGLPVRKIGGWTTAIKQELDEWLLRAKKEEF